MEKERKRVEVGGSRGRREVKVRGEWTDKEIGGRREVERREEWKKEGMEEESGGRGS